MPPELEEDDEDDAEEADPPCPPIDVVCDWEEDCDCEIEPEEKNWLMNWKFTRNWFELPPAFWGMKPGAPTCWPGPYTAGPPYDWPP